VCCAAAKPCQNVENLHFFIKAQNHSFCQSFDIHFGGVMKRKKDGDDMRRMIIILNENVGRIGLMQMASSTSC
jgi:hypothetical protein